MEYFTFARTLALDCGKLIKEAHAIGALCIEQKMSAADLVTKTDKEIEDYTRSQIKTNYPDHKFIGEESSVQNCKLELTDAPTWIVDPVDGTTNFINRFPYFCYSLGLYINKKAEVGIVYAPELNYFFHAVAGKGAYLNDKQIHVNKNTDLEKAIGFCDWGGDRDVGRMKMRTDNIQNVVLNSRGIRSLGSAALHGCLMANGSSDFFFESGAHIWDYAACRLVIEEAGGVCTMFDGSPLDLMKRHMLACANVELLKQLSPLIKPIPYGSD